MARSLRAVEQRTGQMARKHQRWMGIESCFGYSPETPSWGQVVEHFLLRLCESNLETKAFDTV